MKSSIKRVGKGEEIKICDKHVDNQQQSKTLVKITEAA